MRVPPIRLLFALAGIAFFGLPFGLYAAGVTAGSFENRRLAEAPRVSQGWAAFQQSTHFLTDRLPLREEAVRLNTRIWLDAFGMLPRYGQEASAFAGDGLPFVGAIEEAPQEEGQPGGGRFAPLEVFVGRDGWLFGGYEFDGPCPLPGEREAAIENWVDLVALLRKSGRNVALFVPADKGTIYPEYFPEEAPRQMCEKAKEKLWTRLEATPVSAGIVPLRSSMLRAKQQIGDEIFLKKDTHWNPLGSLVLVREAIDRLGGGVRVRRDEVDPISPISYLGDLSVIAGLSTRDETPAVILERKPAAPVMPGRTVMVADSFGALPTIQLAPYVSPGGLRVVSWKNTPREVIAREIERADTVILEKVERELVWQGLNGVPLLMALLQGGLGHMQARSPASAPPRPASGSAASLGDREEETIATAVASCRARAGTLDSGSVWLALLCEQIAAAFRREWEDGTAAGRRSGPAIARCYGLADLAPPGEVQDAVGDLCAALAGI